MTIRFATPTEIAQWNSLVLNNPDRGNILQGKEFADQKQEDGWTPRYLRYDSLVILILEKRVFGLGGIWYAPKGPGISTTRELKKLLPKLRKLAAEHNVFMIKVEPELSESDETRSDLMKLELVRVRPIQPNFSTITLDISDNLTSVMAHLNQKGRHAINRAKRDGVQTRMVDATDDNCRFMYDLLVATAAGSFAVRDYDYYKRFWQRYASNGLGQLFFAYVDTDVVAGAYAIAFGEKGTYKDGASIRERTVYGASHLLQWQIIEWMKAKGVNIYDLCGAPPSSQIKNPDHPHYGIGRFKTSFNKKVTDYVGAYDIIINPTAYKLWRKFGERLIMKLYRIFKHHGYY